MKSILKIFFMLVFVGTGTFTQASVYAAPSPGQYTLTLTLTDGSDANGSHFAGILYGTLKQGSGPYPLDTKITNCGRGGSCTAVYPAGTQLRMISASGDNTQDGKWLNCPGSTSSYCDITVDSDKSFTYAQPRVDIAPLPKPANGAIVARRRCVDLACANNSVTATADTGYAFVSWSGSCAGQGNPCTMATNDNNFSNISATFKPVGSFTVTLTSTKTFQYATVRTGSGVYPLDTKLTACGRGGACSASYSAGTLLRIIAAPSGGSYHPWASCPGPSNNYTCDVDVTANRSVAY